jgi:ABC-type glutathione transport system ATPase component
MEEFKKRGLSMIVVSHDYSIIRTTATKVLGLSAHGYFFESASSPNIIEKINSLFGTLHHEECPYPHGNS